ncbi:MAG: hypothetical protein QNJ09_11575 [Paracoccaceae bacterium]|nr:hypothetical protein [Paracoccaceae bacterium]
MSKSAATQQVIGIFATIAAIFAVTGSLFSVFFAGDYLKLEPTQDLAELRKNIIAVQQEELDGLRREILGDVSAFLESVPIPEGTEVNAQIKRLDGRIDEAIEKLRIVDTIATAIQESPERAMSIPILRRDVDAISEEVSEDLLSIRGEIDRIYDLGKWFLGLIGTMAIGVLGLAVGNLLKGRE